MKPCLLFGRLERPESFAQHSNITTLEMTSLTQNFKIRSFTHNQSKYLPNEEQWGTSTLYLYPLLPVFLKKFCWCPWYPSRTCVEEKKICGGAPHGSYRGPPSQRLVFGWSSVFCLRSVFNRRNRNQICFGDPNRGGALSFTHFITPTLIKRFYL